MYIQLKILQTNQPTNNDRIKTSPRIWSQETAAPWIKNCWLGGFRNIVYRGRIIMILLNHHLYVVILAGLRDIARPRVLNMEFQIAKSIHDDGGNADKGGQDGEDQGDNSARGEAAGERRLLRVLPGQIEEVVEVASRVAFGGDAGGRADIVVLLGDAGALLELSRRFDH